MAIYTTNVFGAILGYRKIKWDATWNFLAWLFDPHQGHALQHAVVSPLLLRVFGQTLESCELQTEVNIGEGEDGRSKWPDLVIFVPSKESPNYVVVMDDVDVRSPGQLRKLQNLGAYGTLARKRYGEAIVRTVVVTNAVRPPSVEKVKSAIQRILGMASEALPDANSWHLISLLDVGQWVQAALAARTVDITA
jgi:hypothetical protein